MAFRKKTTTSDDVFCLTLPLWSPVWSRDYLDKLFQSCNNVKNSLIADRLNALKQLERTKAWRNNQTEIVASYKAEEAALDPKERKQVASQRNTLFQKKKAMLDAFGISKGAFEKAVKAPQHHYRKIVNSAVAQKIAADVWKSFETYLYGNGKDIHFSKITEFSSIEGKSNTTGIIYRDGYLEINNKVRIRVMTNKKDPYGYETEALSREVHYCKIIRRPSPTGWQYFVQLVLSGKPPMKVDQRTGEVMHTLGKGRVGNDIGPQTLATVSDSTVRLDMLCENIQSINDEIRRVNRAMDRSRRATNPKMFNDKGEVVTIDRLPEECTIVIRGKKCRKWVDSKRYKELSQYRRYLYSKQAIRRIQSHNALANKLLTLGDEHYIETMNWQSLAKRSKKTEISEKTGKHKRKKRFGKSIANKAPSLFMKIYERKVKEAGGKFTCINTVKAKASQFNHETKAYKKKHLSQRWNTMEDGTKIQRDLYSAFLIQNTNEAGDGFIQTLLDEKYEQFKKLHDAEIERLKRISTPSSTGVKKSA